MSVKDNVNGINNVKENVHKSGDKSEDGKEMINSKLIGTDYSYKHEIMWGHAFGFVMMHVLGLWGVFIALTGGASYKTILWSCVLGYFTSESISIGAHRLFSHRSFKASPLLRAILIFFFTMTGENDLFFWCRDHRLHHRYADTDYDPHNSKRGFFFSHVGWLMMRRHPKCIEMGKKIDMSDLEADWMVMFQKKYYYYYLHILIAFMIPVLVPYYYFGETFKNSVLICYFARYALQVNAVWLVNSAAHIYGTRPYDKKIQPVESWFVSLITLGEGWHNYHHSFPWDYNAAELFRHFNPSASLIRFFEKIGLASDLKTVSPDMVKTRINNCGDGTHPEMGNDKDRNSVTAFGILHPLNPTYSVVYPVPHTFIEPHGLPLDHENDILHFD